MSSFCVDSEASSSFVCRHLNVSSEWIGPYSVSLACLIAMISTYIIFVCVDWEFQVTESKFVKSDFGMPGDSDYQSLQLRSNANMHQDYSTFSIKTLKTFLIIFGFILLVHVAFVYDQTSNYHTMALREQQQQQQVKHPPHHGQGQDETKETLLPSATDKIRANTQFSHYDNNQNGNNFQQTPDNNIVLSGTVAC